MTYGAISAIADSIGSVGIVISLIYVAIQVRQNSKLIDQNTQATRSSMIHDVSVSYNQMYELLCQNDELTDIYRRGIANETMQPNELIRFEALLNIIMTWFEDADTQFRAQMSYSTDTGIDLLASMIESYRPMLSSNIGRDWWAREGRLLHDPDFYHRMNPFFVKWNAEEAARETTNPPHETTEASDAT